MDQRVADPANFGSHCLTRARRFALILLLLVTLGNGIAWSNDEGTEAQSSVEPATRPEDACVSADGRNVCVEPPTPDQLIHFTLPSVDFGAVEVGEKSQLVIVNLVNQGTQPFALDCQSSAVPKQPFFIELDCPGRPAGIRPSSKSKC